MDNICFDCGAKWKAPMHADQCARCKAREDATYANVPPDPEEDKLFRRHRRPPRVGEGGIEPSGKPLPEVTSWQTVSPGPLMMCRCGTAGTQFVGTGMLSREVVCEECGRAEEREALRRRSEGSRRQAS